MGSPPKLTTDQRAAALVKAARARRTRADLRKELCSGQTSIADVLALSGDDLVGGIKVKAIITAVPGFGKVKASRLMDEIGISENRRLRGLGRKQREALLAALS